MSIFDGFSAFNFGEGAPYISITKNGVGFNKGVIMKMKYPTRVVLLINDQTKQIAIKACEENEENSTDFYNGDKKGNALSVRWNGRDLLNTIQNMMSWDLTSDSYRALGTLIPEESAMLFDLTQATILK